MSDTENTGSERLDPIDETVLEVLAGTDNASTAYIALDADCTEEEAESALERLCSYQLVGRGQPNNIWWATPAGRLLVRYLDTES